MEWTRHGPAQEGLTTKHFSRLICLFVPQILTGRLLQADSVWVLGGRERSSALRVGQNRKVGSSVAGGGEVCG